TPAAHAGRLAGLWTLHFQLPRRAVGAADHLVAHVGVLAGELVGLGVPGQLLTRPQRDDAQVADDHRAGPHGHVADRLLPGLDAVQEVAHVVGRPRRVQLRVLLERLGQDLGVAGHDRAAADEHLAVLAEDHDAVLASPDLLGRALGVEQLGLGALLTLG